MSRQMIYPDECHAIRGAGYEVYRELGSGFREEVCILGTDPPIANKIKGSKGSVPGFRV